MADQHDALAEHGRRERSDSLCGPMEIEIIHQIKVRKTFFIHVQKLAHSYNKKLYFKFHFGYLE